MVVSIDVLKSFLGREGWAKFEANYVKLDKPFPTMVGEAIIGVAFVWAASPEGHVYWQHRDEEWKHFLRVQEELQMKAESRKSRTRVSLSQDELRVLQVALNELERPIEIASSELIKNLQDKLHRAIARVTE